MPDPKIRIQLDTDDVRKGARQAQDALNDVQKSGSRLDRGISKVEKRFRSFRDSASRMTKNLFSMKSALAATAGAAGLGLLINKSLAAADSIAKTADSIGISTDALQKYRYIAERSGVATGQLDQGMTAFVKRLGELRSGTGALNTILNKHNQELKQQLINSQNTTEALDLYFQELKNIENQSTRAALSSAAFSRTAGVAMTNMIDNVDALSARYERLGINIEEDLLRKSEDAKDSVDDLTYVIKNSFTRAVIALAPEIGSAADNMAEWVSSNKSFLTQDVPNKIRETATAVSEFVNSDGFKALVENWEAIAGFAVGKSFGPWGAAAGAIAGYVGSNRGEITKNWFPDMDIASKEEKGFWHFLYSRQPVGGGGGSWGGNVQTNQQFAQFVGTLNAMDYRLQGVEKLTRLSVLQDRKTPSPDGDKKQTSLQIPNLPKNGLDTKAYGALGLNYTPETPELELPSFGKVLEEQIKLKEKTNETTTAVNELYAGLSQGLAKYINRYGNAADRMKNTTSSIVYSMETAFTDFLDTTSGKFMDFRKLALNVLNDIQRQLARMLVQQTITNIAGSFLTGGLNTGAPAHVVAGGITAFGMHSGGIVGQESSFSRTMPPGTFNNAPRLHDGLKSDEFPAILQKGERVIPKDEKEKSTKIINVLDPSVVGDYMQTQEGEEMILNIMQKNKGAI